MVRPAGREELGYLLVYPLGDDDWDVCYRLRAGTRPKDRDLVLGGARVLQVPPPRAGRKPGSGWVRDKAQFLAIVTPIVRGYRAKGVNPLHKDVVRLLPQQHGYVDPSTLTHTYQRLGWRSWQDVLAEIPN
jgi:hypothetical protein